MPLCLRFVLSAHRTPVVMYRPCPPRSFKIEQQYRANRVGGISFCGIKLHIVTRSPL